MISTLTAEQRMRVENIIGMFQRGEIPRPNVHWMLSKDLVEHRVEIARLNAEIRRLKEVHEGDDGP